MFKNYKFMSKLECSPMSKLLERYRMLYSVSKVIITDEDILESCIVKADDAHVQVID